MASQARSILMLLNNPLVSDARVEKEAASLVDAGHTVKVFAEENDKLPTEEVRHGFTICRIIHPIVYKFGYRKEADAPVSALVNRIKEEEVDVLHCHDYHMLFVGIEAKKQVPAIKLIYDSHEYLKGYPLFRGSKGRLNKLKGRVVWAKDKHRERAALKQTDAIITASDNFMQLFQRDFKFTRPIAFLRNIPFDFELRQEKALHQHFKIPEAERVLIHSGNIYYDRKNFEALLDTVANIDNLRLVFMVDQVKAASFGKIVQQRKLENKVFFHDYVATEEVGPLISTADIGLVHIPGTWKSRWLTSANRISEYAMAGLPVVSNNHPQSVAMNREFKHTRFYSIRNPKSLHLAINECMTEHAALKQNALKARGKLSWELEATKLLKLYEKI